MKDRAVFAKILVKQQPVHFQIDCGANVNMLPLKYADGEKLTLCSQTLVMWNGTKVKPVGTCATPVMNPKNIEKFRVGFLVVKEDLTPLLGLTTALLCGGWMPETSWSFHYWQPAPRWRLHQWLAKPDNPAMSPHVPERHPSH